MANQPTLFKCTLAKFVVALPFAYYTVINVEVPHVKIRTVAAASNFNKLKVILMTKTS